MSVLRTNYDPQGLEYGIEVGIYSNDQQFVKEVENWFTYLYNNATHVLKSNPSLREFKDAYIPSYRIPNLAIIEDLIVLLAPLTKISDVDPIILKNLSIP